MDTMKIVGEIDYARSVITAVERLLRDRDPEATVLLDDVRTRLTALADLLEPGADVETLIDA
jgi:hypothetical protein